LGYKTEIHCIEKNHNAQFSTNLILNVEIEKERASRKKQLKE